MQTSKFNRTLFIIVICLLAVIAALSVLLYTSGPRVRIVEYSSDPAKTSFSKNTTITIRFDRPLEQNDYSDQINFYPEVKFTTQTSSQLINITLLDNLQRNTEYYLEVGPEIYDQTGKKMSGVHSHKFTTGEPHYIYIERNYEQTYDETSLAIIDADDHIKLGRIGEEPETIFSAPTITMYTANRDYVVVATTDGKTTYLHTIDMKDRSVRDEQLYFEGRINNLSLSKFGKVALFTLTPDINEVSSEFYGRFAHNAESLDLETGETRTLTNKDGTPIKAYNVQMDTYGSAALIQDLTQTYYAVSPYNDYDPIPIGTYSTSFGFNDESSEIIFRDNENFVVYDVASASTKIIDINFENYIQSLVNKDKKYLSSSTYTSDTITFYIHTSDGWEDTPVEIWNSNARENLLLMNFAVDYDDSLLALQTFRRDCDYDQIAPTTQCKDTKTTIYDTEKNQNLEEFFGFGLTWLP